MVRARNVGRKTEKVSQPDWEQEEFDSRSQIKKAAQAVTSLGEELSELTVSQINKLGLPEDFREAILMLKNMEKGPALKRQKLFVGRFLRNDEELLIEIKAKIESQRVKEKQQNAHFHRLENWRDRMLAEGDEVLNEFVMDFPLADRNQLRQWIRNAKKEAEHNKPPKSSRAMFQYLKGLEW